MTIVIIMGLNKNCRKHFTSNKYFSICFFFFFLRLERDKPTRFYFLNNKNLFQYDIVMDFMKK